MGALGIVLSLLCTGCVCLFQVLMTKQVHLAGAQLI